MQEHPIVIKDRMGFGRWGFSPPWSKEDNKTMPAKMINARSETLVEKPSFRETWQKQRLCLVPANGFYEWHKPDTPDSASKQPYYIHKANNEPLYFGGIWSKTRDQVTFTILTKNADESIKHLHHRMPVIIKEDQVQIWFSGNIDETQHIIETANAADLHYHAVNSDVGKTSNDDQSLIEKITA